MANEVLLVLSTFPDVEIARSISQTLVTEKLAACANILPAVQSIYRWQGKVEEAGEVLVLFKTTTSRFAELQTKLRSQHPYDVPEILALRVADGLPDYLQWVGESCS